MKGWLQRVEHRLNVWTLRMIRWMFPGLLPWLERIYEENNAKLVRLGREPCPPLRWPDEPKENGA